MSVKTGKLSLQYRQFRRSSVVSDYSISSRLFHSRAYIPFVLNFAQLAHCFLYVCSCSSIHPMPFYYCVFSLWHHTEVQYAIIEAGVQCRGLFAAAPHTHGLKHLTGFATCYKRPYSLKLLPYLSIKSGKHFRNTILQNR